MIGGFSTVFGFLFVTVTVSVRLVVLVVFRKVTLDPPEHWQMRNNPSTRDAAVGLVQLTKQLSLNHLHEWHHVSGEYV